VSGGGGSRSSERTADPPGRRVDLPERAEVVVVGGGVLGASITFHLAEAGVPDVLLLERDMLAAGSTSRCAGGVRAQFSEPVNVALGARSLDAFERFDVRPGQPIDLHQPGYLFLVTDPGDVPVFTESAALQNRLGVPTRLLTAEEAAALCPGIVTGDVLLATFHARDGYCSPESVVLGYATGARRHGAVVRSGVEVTGFEVSGGDITAVRTSAGTVRTSTVVCAAGAWSGPLAAHAGVDLPVTPLRRQILVTEPLGPAAEALLPATMPMTIDATTTFYLHREGPAVLLGMSWAGEEPGERLTYGEDWLPDLMDAVDRRCPVLGEVGMARRWAGLYEVTPDHNGLIGESAQVSRFLYATGFSGHGFLQGPAVGEVVRDLCLGRESFVDVSSMSASRFTAQPHVAAAGDGRRERNIV
jgi:sarcosine oxidase subunit beta